MNIPDLSTNAIKALHDKIRECLERDDATPPSQAKPYGVRDTLDWRTQADEFEAELGRRGESCTKIQW